MNTGEFKALLGRYLKRTDLADLYDDWISFTSKRIDSQLHLQEQEYRSVTTPTSQFVALPVDYLEMRHIQSSYSGGTPMEYLTPGQLDKARLRWSSGPMRFYSIVNNQIELLPAPAADNTDTTLEMFYYAKLPALPVDESTNKVLDNHPNLYLYGCMMEAAAFRQSEPDANIYAQLWRDYAQAVEKQQQAGRYGGDAFQMRAG